MNDRGMTLLEVMIAAAIIGTAGLGLIELLVATGRAEMAAREREARLESAQRLLAAHTLLGAVDLDRRLGERQAGEFVVIVQRPESALYRIAVASQHAPAAEELVTVVFRAPAAEPDDSPP